MAILQVGGSRVEYLELGNGEPVVLLHSSGSSSAQWHTLAEQLSERYQAIVPDLYGYGGTGNWPGGRPFHLDCEAEIVLALLAHVNEPVHLVGHSYGGAIALHLAGSCLDLVRSLTLIEPAAFHLLRGMDSAALAEITGIGNAVRRAVVRGEYVSGFERFADYWSAPAAYADVPAYKRYAMAAHLPKIALEFHATLNEPTRLEDFRWITAPTLLLCGTTSPSPARRVCDLLARILPHARVKCITGAGHMAPVTHRDEVNAIVMAHVDSHSAQRFSARNALAPAPS
ncbi:MAG TPA: alpha/beta hydrolase [Burkholderiales bacterium]|nr:alpha/beta hydrolase [Burkholderiales bacterium]